VSDRHPGNRSLRFPAAPATEALHLSVEGDLLDERWERTFLRKARGASRSLRGRSHDRLAALGETFFLEALEPRLSSDGLDRIREARKAGRLIHLESRGSEHVVLPLARHLGADRITCRRLEFRGGLATGRCLPGVWERSLGDGDARPPATLVEQGETGSAAAPFSVRRALAGKTLLLVGVSGFIGKVWLSSLLRDLPEIERIFVLLRRRGARGAADRFEQMVHGSPVFEELASIHGDDFDDWLARRVEVVEGDVTEPDFGLDAETRARIQRSVDVVANCAGLVDFNPDLRDALAVNVDGALHLREFGRKCDHAALLHVSTCYVAGKREGRVPETVYTHEAPSGRRDFDAAAERKWLWQRVEDVVAATRTAGEPNRVTRARLIEIGLQRARELGWPNIYTYTKAIGESVLVSGDAETRVPVAIVRPSIVESSWRFPMRGWNEGINTSAPLSKLLGTYFRQLPVNQRKRLDVIPVDFVCRGMTLVAAALAVRRHQTVYQLATSALNPLDLRRAVELTALAHRRHYRQKPGWRSKVLARLEAVPVSRERYGRLSIPAQLRAVRGLNRVLDRVVPGKPPLARLERVLVRVKELIDLYEPFLLDNEPVFDTDHVEILAASLPESERESFGYDVWSFDWYEYWIHVHIPGLRRWSYPLLEGRPIEPHPRRPAAKPTAPEATPTEAVLSAPPES
jgi:long-chain acyl-CoA synthetase